MRDRTILIVDDEPDVVSYLVLFLEDHGFLTLTAANGKEGYEKAKAERPDLITLDISMPGESGVRMYRNLQEDRETARIPVVIITGISHDFKRFIGTRKHVRAPEAYLEKPINREQLLATIRELLPAVV